MKRMIGLLTLLVCLIPTTTIGKLNNLQIEFEEKRASFSTLYDSFENQIKKSGVYTETGQWTRQFIDAHPVFENFVGKITQITTTKGGGTVSVVIVSSLSKIEVEYHSTVSKSETKVYNQLADLSIGWDVSFSWTPYPDEDTGIKEQSIKERGMVANPWFVGKLSEVMAYKKWDKQVEYYESGKVYFEVNSADGKRGGKGVGYYESGKVKWVLNFVDDKKEGESIGYYESGKMQWKLYYIDDKTEGKSVDYDEAGNITDEDIYKDGECIEKCEKYD